MVHQRNILRSSDEEKNKALKPDHTNNISLVTPKDKFFCRVKVIMTSRYQGRNVELDISRFSTDYGFNIIGYNQNPTKVCATKG